MVDTRTNQGKAACAGALAAVVVGLGVLVGWLFDLEFLKRIVPNLVAMNPATAVAFILTGASLALFLQSPPGRDQKSRALILTARLCALVVTLIGLAKLADIWFGSDFGVDRWLFASKLSDGLRTPNRIATNTAFSFLLLGSALLFAGMKNRLVVLGVEFSAVLVGFGALLAVLAYAYDIESFYALGDLLPMALHTAITFSVLAVAFLLSHTDRGLLAIFAGDNAGGTMARRLLPAAVLVPAVLGWLMRQGQKAGLYQTGFGEAAVAVGNILVFTILICWSAKVLFSADLVRKNAEALLRESEARTSLLVQSSNIGLWDWNLVTNEVFFSPEWKAQLGYADAELPSRFEEWESRLHPEDRERTIATVKDFRESRRANYEIEFRLRHKDGSWRWILARASSTRDATGQQTRIMGGHIDITERKRAEEALRAREAEFRALAEAMPQMVWITRPDGWNIYFNQQWMDYTGLTLEESLGHGWNKPFHPEDQQRAWDAWKHATTTIGTYSVECRLRRTDEVYRWWLIRGVPQLDTTGNILKWFGTCTDIHDLKAAELEISRANRELRESEEKFRQLAANVTDVFYLTSPNMQQMHYVSPAYERIWGRSVESLYANPRQWGEAILPEDRDRVWTTFSRLATGDASVSAEFRIARPDGTVRWILSRGFQVRDAAGKVIRITGNASDITERKRVQGELDDTHRQLVEASRRSGMTEIATNVLHNVGNVLNSVNVSTGLIVDSVKKSKVSRLARVVALLREHAPDLGEFITQDAKGKKVPVYLAQLSEQLLSDQAALVGEMDSLRRNVEHIKEIVAMQQSYAKFGGVKEMINVVDLVEDSLRMHEVALSCHRVEVVREFESAPPINVEKHKILQILVNLLSNAKHACQDSERADKLLTVRVANGDGRIKISVMDNGVGIPPENLNRIFNYGFTTRKEGHGFGLHSGALAAKEMGGSLTVRSAGPGQGAKFTLELPNSTREKAHE